MLGVLYQLYASNEQSNKYCDKPKWSRALQSKHQKGRNGQVNAKAQLMHLKAWYTCSSNGDNSFVQLQPPN